MDLSRSRYGDLAGGETTAHQHLSDESFLTAIIEFERALTDVAESLGVIGAREADAARDAYERHRLDVAEVSRASAAGGNPAIPIVAGIKALTPGHTRGVHTGATSQDAVDTALVLCVRRAGEVIAAQLGEVEELLGQLALTHRATPVMGRTLGQQALPTTFGLVAAGWLSAVHRAGEEFSRAVAALPVQYAGATGTLAAVHPHGVALHDGLADRLGLAARPLVWHTDRLPFTAVGVAAAQLCGAVRKVAGDIIASSASEIGELAEASPGGSSSMPHKANPAAAVACDGYARRAPGLAATLLDALDCRWQRGVGSWHAEWQVLRDLVAVTASAVSRLHASLDGLRINTATMARNMAVTGNGPESATGHAHELVDLILADLNQERTHDE